MAKQKKAKKRPLRIKRGRVKVGTKSFSVKNMTADKSIPVSGHTVNIFVDRTRRASKPKDKLSVAQQPLYNANTMFMSNLAGNVQSVQNQLNRMLSQDIRPIDRIRGDPMDDLLQSNIRQQQLQLQQQLMQQQQPPQPQQPPMMPAVALLQPQPQPSLIGESIRGVAGLAGDTARGVSSFGAEAARGVAGLAGETARGVAGLAGDTARGVAGLTGEAVRGVSGLAGDTARGAVGLASETARGVAGLSADAIRGISSIGAEGVREIAALPVSAVRGIGTLGSEGVRALASMGVDAVRATTGVSAEVLGHILTLSDSTLRSLGSLGNDAIRGLGSLGSDALRGLASTLFAPAAVPPAPPAPPIPPPAPPMPPPAPPVINIRIGDIGATIKRKEGAEKAAEHTLTLMEELEEKQRKRKGKTVEEIAAAVAAEREATRERERQSEGETLHGRLMEAIRSRRPAFEEDISEEGEDVFEDVPEISPEVNIPTMVESGIPITNPVPVPVPAPAPSPIGSAVEPSEEELQRAIKESEESAVLEAIAREPMPVSPPTGAEGKEEEPPAVPADIAAQAAELEAIRAKGKPEDEPEGEPEERQPEPAEERQPEPEPEEELTRMSDFLKLSDDDVLKFYYTGKKFDNERQVNDYIKERARKGKETGGSLIQHINSLLKTKGQPVLSAKQFTNAIKELEKRYPDRKEPIAQYIKDIVSNSTLSISTMTRVMMDRMFPRPAGSGNKQGGDVLSNFEIEDMMRPYEYSGKFFGTYSDTDFANEIIPRIKEAQSHNGLDKVSAIVLNDPDKDDFGHWVCVVIDPIDEMSAMYYDPLADPPTDNMERQIKKIVKAMGCPTMLKLKVNRIKEQSENSSTCGYHSMLKVIELLNGKPWKQASGYSNVMKSESKVRRFINAMNGQLPKYKYI